MKIFLSSLLLTAFLTWFGGATPVQAGPTVKVDCSPISRNACEVVKHALTRAPYVGPIRPAHEPMACARVVSYKPVPVVWIAGTDRNFRSAPVITNTGIVYTERFGLKRRWIVTESCIPRRLLRGVKHLTLCTGQQGSFHWALTQRELEEMKRTGHFTSYVPFLTVSDRDSLSAREVTALYKARYFARR